MKALKLVDAKLIIKLLRLEASRLAREVGRGIPHRSYYYTRKDRLLDKARLRKAKRELKVIEKTIERFKLEVNSLYGSGINGEK